MNIRLYVLYIMRELLWKEATKFQNCLKSLIKQNIC